MGIGPGSRVVEALPAPRVSPFPAVFQDVSLVVSVRVPAQAVADAVREGAGELLEDIELLGVFTGSADR
jgi:phenylalanyl-tRNA synthetase beta chain